MPKGTVKWFNESKGFGFISFDEGGDDIFVHAQDVAGNPLQDGDEVDFDIGNDRRNGKERAENVRGGTGRPEMVDKGPRLGAGEGNLTIFCFIKNPFGFIDL